MAISVACMLTFSACSTDDVLSITDTKQITKTPIELTVGVVGESPSAYTRGTSDPVTRSVVTLDNNNNNKAQAFSAGTSLYMVIKSEDASDANDTYTRTIGYAQTQADTYNTTVNFTDAYKRYWEDSHSRNSRISIYSACVPGYYLAASKPSDITANGTADGTTWTIGGSTTYDNTWGTDKGSTTIAWPLRSASVANQTAANGFIANQDLCFSNNVAYPTGGTDSRIKFNESTLKFNTGRLVYYHALTWVTFKIKKGEGFESTDAFAFSNSNENIVLTDFNTSGTFDVTEGEFKTSDPAIGTATISELAVETPSTEDAAAGYVHVLHGLMLPGSALTSTATNEIYFTIDGNLYHITKEQLKNAVVSETLSDNTTTALTDDFKMRPGVHYIFTMTVGKKKVDNITASVVDWETVNADETTPTNARIVVSLLENGTKKTGTADFDLYRATNTSSTINDAYESYAWTTGYTLSGCKAALDESSTGVYAAKDATSPNPVWFWPDNKTFYHFRTVMPKDHTVNAKTESTEGDYLTLTAASSYIDVCWGAPFYQTTDKLIYTTTNGFEYKSDNTTHQISKAIGATTGQINLEMFHMMSDVTIQLTTTSGDDKVDLSNATVQLSNTYADGKVLMGNGKVVTGTLSSPAVNGTVDSDKKFHYGFIPQSLDNVVLTITTTDNNQYIIDMDEVKATAVGNALIANPYSETSSGSGKYTIDAWYPNYQYTYTFKLTKTDISKITATIANWHEMIIKEKNRVLQEQKEQSGQKQSQRSGKRQKSL